MGSLAVVVAVQMIMIAGQGAPTEGQAGPERGNGRIHGVVVYPEGGGFPGVGVTITHQASHTEYSVRANFRGQYDFTNLPAGTYNVLLKAPPTPVRFKILRILSVEVVQGQTITLESKIPVCDKCDYVSDVLVMTPPTSGDLEGVVRDDLGAVMADVDVALIGPDSNLERKTQTNSEGRYRFIDLQPGKYEVRMNGKGFPVKTASAKAQEEPPT